MKLVTLLIVTIVGRIPGTYVLTMQGASIHNHEYYTAIVFAVVAAVILLVAFIAARFFTGSSERNER
jgi:uncharacterized membrane protein YeaQ/YmgE (transglycosylase-associated protein family)